MKIKQHIASIILLAVLLIASIGTYLCYPFINQALQRSNYEISDINHYMFLDLPGYCYGADYLLKQKNDSSTTLAAYNPISLPENISEDFFIIFNIN
ncbi:hypothetical protein NMU03_04720 [Allocoprobacillus halotolerans]|uniref:Uncharacterized protein n=1 Tax=Allocoprobacillus halotolerans TaxID=2944914 RepID=A0ABY5I422_9FIRM|nr:hypothetical protein [Allocoprobacillus halotolerans]UTY40107.1 hypothetical protein NMU03_04720 [Allocoprobacillus halotolerans]